MKPKMIWIVMLGFVILLTVFVGLKITYKKTSDPISSVKKKELYFCPMHPSVTSDHADRCPICHMPLQKADDSRKQGKEKKILFYRHPMRPDVTSPVLAKDEMGMDYVPVYEDEMEESETSGISGRASFSLSQERQQLIGVTTTKVISRELSYEIRANGKVAFDPELFSVIEEYRQAVWGEAEMSKSAYPELREGAKNLVSSAETKLKLMGLSESQIQGLRESKTESMNLLLPKGSVWIYAEIFEYEISGLKIGQEMSASAPSVPGKIFLGRVSSISPILNTPTRTLRVRAEVPDPQNMLRPDTFVNVKIKIEFGKKLSVPVDAVLHSGDQTFVFIAKEKGVFLPRAITVGIKTNDYYEVISGLEEGEIVVSGANFLIDSESRLRSTLKPMEGEHHHP